MSDDQIRLEQKADKIIEKVQSQRKAEPQTHYVLSTDDMESAMDSPNTEGAGLMENPYLGSLSAQSGSRHDLNPEGKIRDYKNEILNQQENLKLTTNIMLAYSVMCLIFKVYDMFGIADRLKRVETVHETKVLMLHDAVKKLAGQDPKNSIEDKEKRAKLVEVFYFINIISLVVCIFTCAACGYLKWSLQENLIFSVTQYRKFIYIFFGVFAMTLLSLLVVSHKLVSFAWSDMMKWIEVFLLFSHMLSENSSFVFIEALFTGLLMFGIAILAVISSRIEKTVTKLEKLQSKMDASIQLESVKE